MLGRLRYAYKILVVPVVLLLLGFVAKAYVDLQRGQVAFSAKERVGVAYLVPLRAMVAAFGAVAAGDLTRSVPVQTRDEVREMAGALNHAITRVRDAVRAIGGSAIGLAASSDELSAVSGNLNATAEEAAAQARTAAATAEQVSGNVDTVAAGTDEMTASITEIAKSASQAAGVAAQAVATAEQANQTVARLSASSAEVGDVVKVITAIASRPACWP